MADKKDCYADGASHGDQKGHAKMDGKHGHKQSKKMIRRMAKTLNLTDVQEDAVKALMQAQHEGMSGHQDVMSLQLDQLAQLDAGSDAYMAKAKEIGTLQGEAMGQRLIERGNTQAKIMDLLTPEQAEEYQQMHKKMARR